MNVVRPQEVGLSPAGLDRIRSAMQEYVDRNQLPGAITLVARRGQVAHFECHGMRDVEAGKPMRPDTLFRIYSMTKPITAVALMMLLEEGRLQLNDPVSRFIPAFSDLKVYVRSTDPSVELASLDKEITIFDLLTHTSGLGYGGPLKSYQDLPVEAMSGL